MILNGRALRFRTTVAQSSLGLKTKPSLGCRFMSRSYAEAGCGLPLDAERERTLNEQLPQVRNIAHGIYRRIERRVPIEDLIHSGIVGLIDALNKFDPAKHIKFCVYARHRIRGAILDSLRELDWSPRQLRRQGRMIQKADSVLSARLGRRPDESELAAELGLDLPALQSLLADLARHQLDTLSEESHDVFASSHESPLSVCLRAEMGQLLATAMTELTTSEQRVISLYYGDELTMKNIAKTLGVGHRRVAHIHALAVARLRSLLGGRLRRRITVARAMSAPQPSIHDGTIAGPKRTRYR